MCCSLVNNTAIGKLNLMDKPQAAQLWYLNHLNSPPTVPSAAHRWYPRSSGFRCCRKPPHTWTRWTEPFSHRPVKLLMIRTSTCLNVWFRFGKFSNRSRTASRFNLHMLNVNSTKVYHKEFYTIEIFCLNYSIEKLFICFFLPCAPFKCKLKIYYITR